MKRVALLIIAFLFIFMNATAEDIDVDSMNMDELLDLQARINERIAELISQNGNDAIYEGYYRVGKDIRPGIYLLTNIGDGYFGIKRYLNEDVYRYFDQKYDIQNPDYYLKYSLHPGETRRIVFEDNMIVEIFVGTAILLPTSKPSWEP